MRKNGIEFKGVLFPGLKMTKDGPKVLEFNARFGDPETQSYMRLLKTDLYEIFDACVNGKLKDIKLEWESKFTACVVLASGGYPDQYEKGLKISGVEDVENTEGIKVFHAGTNFDGELKTSGGRVLGVSAVGDTLKEAIEKSYEGVKKINFEGKQFRTDIGAKSLVDK